MNQYFKCSIKVAFEAENGKVKYKRESYIVSAITPTEVEKKINDLLSGADFEITNISTTNIVDIIK